MLVIVHGLGRHADEWSEWASDDTLIPDLPELRRSDSAPDPARAITRVLAQLDRRGIARATWLGHSGGAHLALDVARQYPERVARVIIVAAAPSVRILDAVRCPVLVVLGARDGLTVEARPHVQVEVIAGAGHDPHLDAPEELRGLIARWSALVG